jgi:fibronectin type 3 domain-containing protein
MRNSHKIILSTLSLIALAGCNSGPAVFSELNIHQSLPTPSEVRTISDMNSVGLEWALIKDPKIVGYTIYRSAGNGKLHRVATVDNRFTTHYVDMDLEPRMEYHYRIASIDEEGFESTPSFTTIANTLDRPEAISFIHVVENLPRMSKIIFRPHSDSRITHYKIERRTSTEPKWNEIDTIEGRLNAEYIDNDLEDSKVYEYRIIAVTFDDVETYVSASTKGSTKNLPPAITNITTSKNRAKKIVVNWSRLSNDEKIVYNIYSSSSSYGHFELAGRVKNKATFEEKIDKDGYNKYYYVTSVDEDGLESERAENAVIGNTQVKPLTPVVSQSDIIDGVATLSWQSSDKRVSSFKIIRTRIESLFSTEDKIFEDIHARSFKDNTNPLEIGIEYRYKIIAVDADGIESYPSEAVTILNKVEAN